MYPPAFSIPLASRLSTGFSNSSARRHRRLQRANSRLRVEECALLSRLYFVGYNEHVQALIPLYDVGMFELNIVLLIVVVEQ